MSGAMAGIYKIENLDNGKIYIGSSKNIEKRWSQHLNLLKRNKHHSAHLQYSWNMYGEKSFVFKVIEEVSNVEDLFVREQYYIDQYKSYDEQNGYNICELAGSANRTTSVNLKYKNMLQDQQQKEEKFIYVYEFIDNQKPNVFSPSMSKNKKFIFRTLIVGLFVYYKLELIDDSQGIELQLYTKDKYINLYNFQNLSDDEFNEILDKNDLQMLKIIDYGHNKSFNIYKTELRWYKFSYDKDTKFCKLITQTQYETEEVILSYIQ